MSVLVRMHRGWRRADAAPCLSTAAAAAATAAWSSSVAALQRVVSPTSTMPAMQPLKP